MTLLAAERLTVDGVDIKTYAKNVETLGATLRSPSRRGANGVTAGRSGSLRTPSKMHDSPTYVWPMWVQGCDDDGAIPSGSARIEFYKRVDELTALFDKDGTLDIRHWQPGSESADVINWVFNPDLTATSGTIVARTNRAINPRAVSLSTYNTNNTAIAPVTFDASANIATEYGASAVVFTRANSATAPTQVMSGYFGPPAGLTTSWPVVPAAQFRFSIGVKVETLGRRVNCYINFIDSAGAVMAGQYGQNFTTSVSANQVLRVGAESIVPAGAAYAIGCITADTGGGAINATFGERIWLSGMMAEDSLGLRTYFDGATSASGDFTYAWSGAVNTSTSEQRGIGLANWLGNAAALYQIQGSKGRLAARNTTQVGHAAYTNAVTGASIGTYWSGRMTVTNPDPTNAISVRVAIHDGVIFVASITVTVPAATTMEISSPATTATTGTLPRLYLYMLTANQAVELDKAVLSQVSGAGIPAPNYFDGNGAGYVWNGTPNASSSTKKANVRQAFCECLGALDFTTKGINPLGRVSVELLNLSGYWQDLYDTTQTVAPGSLTLDRFNDTTAPIDDATYVITGPATNPRITDLTTGAYVQYNGALTAGQTLTLNAATWTITGSGFTALLANLVVVGQTRLMRLVPNNVTRQINITFAATGSTGATTLTVTGRRKYLIG